MPRAALGFVAPTVDGPLIVLSSFMEQPAHILCFGIFIAAWGDGKWSTPKKTSEGQASLARKPGSKRFLQVHSHSSLPHLHSVPKVTPSRFEAMSAHVPRSSQDTTKRTKRLSAKRVVPFRLRCNSSFSDALA